LEDLAPTEERPEDLEAQAASHLGDLGAEEVRLRASPPPEGWIGRRVTPEGSPPLWLAVRPGSRRNGDEGRLDLVAELVEARLTVGHLQRDLRVLAERFAEVQRRMVDQNRLAALGTMAASVAHDIRSPLTVLLSNLTYVEDVLDLEADPQLAEIVEDNRLAIQLIEGVLESLRSFGSEQETPGMVPLECVVQTAVRSSRWYFSQGDVDLDVRVEGTPVGRGTGGELGQILNNLLSNAAEASPPGSTVRGDRPAGAGGLGHLGPRRGAGGAGGAVGRRLRALPHLQGNGHGPRPVHRPRDGLPPRRQPQGPRVPGGSRTVRRRMLRAPPGGRRPPMSRGPRGP
jgi:signal transduction histidine kinase